MTLSEMKAAIEAEMGKAKAVANAAEAKGGALSAEDRTTIKSHMDEAGRLLALRKQAVDDADMLKSLGDLTAGGVKDLFTTGGEKTKAAPDGSSGQRFVKSEAWGEFVGRWPGGRIPESAKGLTSGPVELGGMKALLTGADPTSAGAFVEPTRYPFVDLATRPLTIRQLVTNGNTQSDSIEFVRQGTLTNNAAPVPEATSAARIGAAAGEVTAVAGGLKPESGFILEKITTPVKTIAHWLPSTKRALSDAGQITTLIDAFLVTGLAEALEDQLVSGDGNGENLRGILTTPGTTAQAYVDDLLVTTRQAKMKCRVIGRATPTAYVFNPEDNMRIDLLRENADGGGAFMFGGPAATGTQTLWGIPRIESEAIPVGTGLLADWRQAVLWDREQATVQVSDSHQDFFVRNLVAFLAELRAAFGILRPAAFVEIDLTA